VRGSWPLWRAGLVAQVVQQAAHWPWESMLAAVMAGLAASKTPPRRPDADAATSDIDGH
jgi:hypothetical protein